MSHDKAPQILIKQKAISHPQILNVISHGQAIISIKTHFKVRSKPKSSMGTHFPQINYPSDTLREILRDRLCALQRGLL